MVVYSYPRIAPLTRRGRLAKTTSFLLRQSSAADVDETRRARRAPNWRPTTGPYLWEMCNSVRWIVVELLRRWRWPNMGKVGNGVGGRFWNLLRNCLVMM